MAAILFYGAEPFEQIGINPFNRRPHRNPMKITQAVSKKKSFKNYTILYMCIAQGQRQITVRGQNFDITKLFYSFNHSL